MQALNFFSTAQDDRYETLILGEQKKQSSGFRTKSLVAVFAVAMVVAACGCQWALQDAP